MNTISVPPAGDFATALRAILRDRKPRRVIETGTFDGSGSTEVILSALPPDAQFITVECDRGRHLLALARHDGHPVFCWLGLTLPRPMLPTAEETRAILDTPPGIKHDAATIDRETAHRLAECDRPDVPDDCLGAAVRYHQGRPDFVLLDSAGHLGFLEFSYLLTLIQGPCVIALDDTQHVKHWRSLALARTDPRFTILKEGNEKNGWAILEYKPEIKGEGNGDGQ